jgi:phage portal protein BeeE
MVWCKFWWMASRHRLRFLVIRGLMLPGAIRGLSPVEYARQIIGLGLGAQDQAARFFGQGSVVPGVIQTSGSLTKEQMREIRDQWFAVSWWVSAFASAGGVDG